MKGQKPLSMTEGIPSEVLLRCIQWQTARSYMVLAANDRMIPKQGFNCMVTGVSVVSGKCWASLSIPIQGKETMFSGMFHDNQLIGKNTITSRKCSWLTVYSSLIKTEEYNSIQCKTCRYVFKVIPIQNISKYQTWLWTCANSYHFQGDPGFMSSKAKLSKIQDSIHGKSSCWWREFFPE